MYARATNSLSSTSVEVEKGKPISDSSRKSKDRTSEEKKRKKSSGVNTKDVTDAKGELDSPTADEPAATEKTSSSAPPPQKKQSSRVNTQDDYDATGKGGSDNATVRPASTDDTSSGSIAG